MYINENKLNSLVSTKSNNFEKEISLLNIFKNSTLIDIYKKNSIISDLDNNIFY